jgi:hypothetical protein
MLFYNYYSSNASNSGNVNKTGTGNANNEEEEVIIAGNDSPKNDQKIDAADANADQRDIVNTKNNDSYNNEKSKNTSFAYSYGVEAPVSTLPILFIEEFISQPFSQYDCIDWRAYIFYDATTKSYVLNGTRRRRGEPKTAHPDIRMTFASKSSLAFYLRNSMCAWQHDLSITMYSISRSVLYLSTPNAIPNFHSIHNCRSKFRSELFGYDNCHPSTRKLKSYLKVLRDGIEGNMFR